MQVETSIGSTAFMKVAKITGRKLVITPKTAYLLSKLLADEHLPVPDPLKDETLKVYRLTSKRKNQANTMRKTISPGNAGSSARWLIAGTSTGTGADS